MNTTRMLQIHGMYLNHVWDFPHTAHPVGSLVIMDVRHLSELAGTTEGHWDGTQTTVHRFKLSLRHIDFVSWSVGPVSFSNTDRHVSTVYTFLYSVCTVRNPEGHRGSRTPSKPCQITLSRASKVILANWRLLSAVVGNGDWFLSAELLLYEPYTNQWLTNKDERPEVTVGVRGTLTKK